MAVPSLSPLRRRGPAIWRVWDRRQEIDQQLKAAPPFFFSLRKAAAVLGVSTQPLRDWVRDGLLRSSGQRLSFSKADLQSFLRRLAKEMANQEWKHREDRLVAERRRRPPSKLRRAEFDWPRGRAALTPAELAALVGCHPSLIRKMLDKGQLQRSLRRRGRFEITRQAWQRYLRSPQP